MRETTRLLLLLLPSFCSHLLTFTTLFRTGLYAKRPQTDTRWPVHVATIRGYTKRQRQTKDGHSRSRHEEAPRGDTQPCSTLNLSKNKFFEVVALSPLVAACDAMDAAMLTRKSTGGVATSWARGWQECAAIGRAASMGGGSPEGCASSNSASSSRTLLNVFRIYTTEGNSDCL